MAISYRHFKSRPAVVAATVFAAMALICIARAYFQKGAVGDSAMFALFYMYYPFSLLVDLFSKPVSHFIIDHFLKPNSLLLLWDSITSLTLGTLWYYYAAKTLHWLVQFYFAQPDGEE